MRISPIDIQQQQFKTRTFGYDKVGVDRFLESVAEELERLVRHNLDLEEELAKTRAALLELREREATLKETLMTAQKVTDELKATARREVEVMMSEAELRAERLLHGAEDRRVKLIEQIQEMKRQKIDFETSLRSLLEKHIRMLDMNVLSIGESNDETKLLEESQQSGAATPQKDPVAADKDPEASIDFETPRGSNDDDLLK